MRVMLFILLMFTLCFNSDCAIRRIPNPRIDQQETNKQSVQVIGDSMVSKIANTWTAYRGLFPSLFQCMGAIACETSCLINVVMLCLRMVAKSAQETLVRYGV